jgi:hypothetical protein
MGSSVNIALPVVGREFSMDAITIFAFLCFAGTFASMARGKVRQK